jgi:aspartate/methionine/tyrosine aminotransferase
VISINSFSKYFSDDRLATRLAGAAAALVPAIEKLAQNLFICASTLAQHAALACFEPDSIAEYERRRSEFKARRDLVVPALNAIGLTVPVRARRRVLRLGRLLRAREPAAGTSAST